MKKKKEGEFQDLARFVQQRIVDAGSKCEVCGREESIYLPLHVHFIDRNPKNMKEENIAVFCTGCGGNFIRSNPEGLSTRGGLWAFAINRGLYRNLIKERLKEEKNARRRGKCKSSSPPSASTGGRSKSDEPPRLSSRKGPRRGGGRGSNRR